MAPLRPVSELASIIDRHTKTLENSLKGTPNAAFSLGLGAAPQIHFPGPLEATRGELLEALDELRARILGPVGYFMALLIPTPALLAIFHTLYAFDVASHVPLTANGEITYEELAKRCGLPEDDARRIVQAAIAFRVFEEAVPDVSVRHNALSAALARPEMKDGLGLIVEEQTAGVAKLAESLRRFPGSGEPGHSASVLAFREAQAVREHASLQSELPDPSKSFFDLIAGDERRVARFRSAMGLSTKSAALSATHVVDNLPWADPSQCPKTIVDIGGAGGELCQLLLRSFPAISKAVVLDLPEVVADAKAPEDLQGRLDYASYNFLTEEVTQVADAYLFRHIFHDWSDQYSAKILRNLVPALRKGSKIFVSEVVLPDLSDRKHTKDQRQRSADIFMKIGFNGKERSERGWETLVAAADPRFRIANIINPEGAHDSLIEIAFDV
ncbi:S-adenosyl-L-methionine-dependent methyltransferase [Durotheca rogersii]|uniref:S-adenosyl-L-methionine-dependent methyltransferase n=1 Tax=Durotheca rogersii TaxID=419775 RepID=UPI00221F07D3|nr:S-adenosyl-L-methionine-dependent methyltransferase [Durotheca rogersii]KAI5863290.1 S-adenosyl-L-methionine-dependent methyltransferase [Durotheca rogersii]